MAEHAPLPTSEAPTSAAYTFDEASAGAAIDATIALINRWADNAAVVGPCTTFGRDLMKDVAIDLAANREYLLLAASMEARVGAPALDWTTRRAADAGLALLPKTPGADASPPPSAPNSDPPAPEAGGGQAVAESIRGTKPSGTGDPDND